MPAGNAAGRRKEVNVKRTPISASQVKKIHALKTALSLSDETYRVLLQDGFTVTSSKELSFEDAEILIREMENKAVSIGVWEKRSGCDQTGRDHSRPGMATASQIRKIKMLWGEVTTAQDESSRQRALRSFLERVVKVSDLRFLEVAAASKVINALKQMQARKAKTTHELSTAL